MKQQVGEDVVNALRFYQGVYGESPVARFAATEIPWAHGEAWPGMIGLYWGTFHATGDDGFEELFRAHEVAHQWWGISVDYATYHDRWLSEGLSDFSGLWFMQTRLKNNGKYFDMLDRWKSDILLHRDEPIPVWLGDRVVTKDAEENYNTIVYEKGAWVFHMLRILLLDLKTMSEDRFKVVMKTFYREHAGRRASTEDFENTIESLTGQDMKWFFSEWVYGTGIPTYHVAWHAEGSEGGPQTVRVRIVQERVPPEFLMYLPVTVEMGKGQVARFRLKVTGARTEVALPPLPAKATKVQFNDLSGVLAEVKEEGW
jgi:aminopeptidase N